MVVTRSAKIRSGLNNPDVHFILSLLHSFPLCERVLSGLAKALSLSNIGIPTPVEQLVMFAQPRFAFLYLSLRRTGSSTVAILTTTCFSRYPVATLSYSVYVQRSLSSHGMGRLLIHISNHPLRDFLDAITFHLSLYSMFGKTIKRVRRHETWPEVFCLIAFPFWIQISIAGIKSKYMHSDNHSRQ